MSFDSFHEKFISLYGYPCMRRMLAALLQIHWKGSSKKNNPTHSKYHMDELNPMRPCNHSIVPAVNNPTNKEHSCLFIFTYGMSRFRVEQSTNYKGFFPLAFIFNLVFIHSSYHICLTITRSFFGFQPTQKPNFPSDCEGIKLLLDKNQEG